jgi:alcohol dehydrogenase
MTSWWCSLPTKVIFGAGARSCLVDHLSQGPITVVCTAGGRTRITSDRILGDAFERMGGRVSWVDGVTENPTVASVEAALADQSNEVAESTVIAIGGGSSIDFAKALVAAVAVRGQLTLAQLIAEPEHLEGVSLPPLMAVPTTAGTGSEVTPFATVWDGDGCRKLSLSSERIAPAMAIIDPELLIGSSRNVIASTGLDALNQAIEAVWNQAANPFSDMLALRSAALSMSALPLLAHGRCSASARHDMALASLLAGSAIRHTRTSLCHSISYPLTAHLGVPHGVACAFTMPAVAQRLMESGYTARLALIARHADLEQHTASALVSALTQLCDALGVRSAVRAAAGSFETIANLLPQMFTPGRADNVPMAVTEDILLSILVEAWG